MPEAKRQAIEWTALGLVALGMVIWCAHYMTQDQPALDVSPVNQNHTFHHDTPPSFERAVR